MIPKAVIVHYGGSWDSDAYVGGEKRYILVSPEGMSRLSLLDQIQVMVGVDKDSFKFSLSTLVQSSEGPVRMDVTNDYEFKFAVENVEVPNFYLTFSAIVSSTPAVVRPNFMTLLKAQEVYSHTNQNLIIQDANVVSNDVLSRTHVADDRNQISNESTHDCSDIHDLDDEGFDDEHDEVDSLDNDTVSGGDGSEQLRIGGLAVLRNRHVVPPLVSSSIDEHSHDKTLRRDCSSSGQWIIPGAIYQTSLPVDDLEHCQPYSRDSLSKGATFKDKESMLISVGLYHLLNRVEYTVERSCTERYEVVCKHSEQCRFSMRATSKKGCTFWMVILWNAPHTCRSDFRAHGPRSVPSKIIGAYFAPTLMVEGAVLKPKEMAAHLKIQYGFEIDYPVALAGRNHAISMIYGDSSKSFQLLPSYLHMIQKFNPGSIVDLQTDSEDRFEYAYMSLGASINGFLTSCRPVIVVDGTHLKGKYRGMMFVAVSQDGNKQLFPLAFGIGDKENDKSWIWFFKQLRKTFGCPDNLLIVSDQHCSIKNAVAVVYPGVPHGVCVYHLQKNLARFGDHAVDMFKKAANCYTVHDFEKHMSNLALVSKNGAYQRLMEIGPSRWARSCCEVRRYTFMTSNCAESVNGRLRWARRLPMCTLFEFARTFVGRWFVERRNEALASSNELTRYATQKLELSIEEGLTMVVEAINDFKFRVRNEDKSYVVDLNARTCSCRMFDLDLIPCPHAAASIWKLKQSCASYVSSYYTMETLREIYASDVHPIPHPDEWCVPEEIKTKVVGVPIDPKQAGRQRTRRIPSRGESSSASRSTTTSRACVCSRCNQIGHYRSTCKAYIPNVQIEEQQGTVTRRPKHCSLCHMTGHTKRKCSLYRIDDGNDGGG